MAKSKTPITGFLVTNIILICIFSICHACSADQSAAASEGPTAFRETRTISYNNFTGNVIIDKPASDLVNVLVTFHGTIDNTTTILEAANTTLDKFKALSNATNMMYVSVAYPQNVLFGDSVPWCEAALLWVKNQAEADLGITINKIFIAGHSQGGYVVTRLNTMQQTDGVIANAPGPLNLVYRCELEENGQTNQTIVCGDLIALFGSPATNEEPFFQRSLLNFTDNFKADILFVQGLNDSPIQLYSWPQFKENILNCTTCQNSFFVEVPGAGHGALFQSNEAKTEFNSFIQSRL
jgi:hypothetical protein